MWLGVATGLFMPALSLWIYVLLRYEELTFTEFLQGWFRMGILTHMISLAVLPNLPVFLIALQANMLKAGRGILLATFLYAFTVLIIRFS